MKPIFTLFFLLSVFWSCKKKNKETVDVSNIPVTIKVARFDQEFAKAKPNDIGVLKKAYPYLFPKQYADSVWEAKLKDTIQLELSSEVGKAFPYFKEEAKELELFFKHVKYYFPKEKEPKVVTVTSYVDYRNSVILTDSLLLIGLDNYLGSNHRFYEGIQKYIAATLRKEFLITDVANAFVQKKIAAPKERFFLSQLIYYGKQLYIKEKLIPFKTDAEIIKYTTAQLEWSKANEEQVWRYFIERELLYSTSTKLGGRFLEEAPFSKFQLELDGESPGRIGRYIGWQIVKSFMDKNKVTVEQLLYLSAEEIFKKSRYKPKK